MVVGAFYARAASSQSLDFVVSQSLAAQEGEQLRYNFGKDMIYLLAKGGESLM